MTHNVVCRVDFLSELLVARSGWARARRLRVATFKKDRGASNLTLLYTSGWSWCDRAAYALRYHSRSQSVDSARSQRRGRQWQKHCQNQCHSSKHEGTRPEQRAAFNVMFRAAQCVRESRRDAVTKQRRVKTDCTRIKDATASNVVPSFGIKESGATRTPRAQHQLTPRRTCRDSPALSGATRPSR